MSHSIINSDTGARPNHTKARTERPADYPMRATVPDNRVSWEVSFPTYAPPYYTSQVVMAHDSSADPTNPKLWADPESINLVAHKFVSFEGEVKFDQQSGLPLNPRGRTGVSGRGELGLWGANPAADPIITRINSETNLLEMICIKRGDSLEDAIPGGMVDKRDANISATLSRELGEETKALLEMDKANIVYRGYVDDRRNTDNAWIETTVGHRHLPEAIALSLVLEASDDAHPGSARWVPLTKEFVDQLYASHGQLVRAALYAFRVSGHFKDLPDSAKIQIEAIL